MHLSDRDPTECRLVNEEHARAKESHAMTRGTKLDLEQLFLPSAGTDGIALIHYLVPPSFWLNQNITLYLLLEFKI